MISHLAASLVDRFASSAEHLLDPFCGSGAVLRAASIRGTKVTGVDVNPFGVLLSKVKLEGFDSKRALLLCEELASIAKMSPSLPMNWQKREYWFTPATLRKFEQIRHAAVAMQLSRSKAGRAVLLSIGLAVRPCSRADQRSPKPFISKSARRNRAGKHFDPMDRIQKLLGELSVMYSGRPGTDVEIHQLDMTNKSGITNVITPCSHVITSPPYVNAQDYFRNSKLELYMLEGLLPFSVDCIINRFIGTERGLNNSVIAGEDAENRRSLVPELAWLEKHRTQQAVVVHRYLRDMAVAFRSLRQIIRPSGLFVIVCGDNLIGGRRIPTWKVLNAMLESLGFSLVEQYGDRIRNRALAPMRCGHKGLIKQEFVSAFTL